MNRASEIVGLALQFATQNCLACYSKLNLNSEFHAEVATHLHYNNCYSIVTNCHSIYDSSSNFPTKIASQLYKVISDTGITVIRQNMQHNLLELTLLSA